MEINLVTISKLSSEIIDRDVIEIEHVDFPVMSDLYENIYDKYPALWRSGDYRIFWQYAQNMYYQINDYLSYITAMRLMVNKTIYVLIDDFVNYWEDNIAYLEELDRLEELERRERERDIYDVKINPDVPRRQRLCEIYSNMSLGSMWSIGSIEEAVRTDNEVICYACRNEPKLQFYTTDWTEKAIVIENLKRGYPKFQTELCAIPNVVFAKRALKESGKGRAGKKDKKKNKGDKKKKKKKGGKRK